MKPINFQKIVRPVARILGISTTPSLKLNNKTIPETEALRNFLCTGGTESHKSSAVIYPFLDQIFRQYNTRKGRENCGGLIVDSKGDLLKTVIALMKKHGRDPEKDLILINPDNAKTYQYNLVSPHLSHTQVAQGLRPILNDLAKESGAKSFWLESAEIAIGFAVLLLRIVNEGDTDKNKKEVSLSMVKQIFTDDIYRLINLEKNLEAGGRLVISNATAPTSERLAFEGRIKNINDVQDYFVHKWEIMAPEAKDIIVKLISTELLAGIIDQKSQRVFCKTTDFSMMEACNEGKIIVFQAPNWGTLARIAAITLKADYHRTMSDRISADRNINQSRLCFSLFNDYQDYPASGGRADDGFYAISRQLRTINILFIGSIGGLRDKINDEFSLATLLQNLRNKIFLNPKETHADEDLFLRQFGYKTT